MPLDFHCHAFSEKIAEKAVSFLVDYYHMPAVGKAELPHALQAEAKAGCDSFVLLIAATTPSQVIPANNWAISIHQMSPTELSKISGIKNNPTPIVFGTLHPYFKEMPAEIERLRKAGITGVKIHPEFQGFSLDDPILYPIYEALQDDLILLTHVGDKTKGPNNLSSPQKVRKVITDFPHLKLVAAHLGGYCFWEEVLTELAGKNVYFDLSSTLRFIPPMLLKKIVNSHDHHKLLFGSDYPLGDPATELKLLEETRLFTSEQLEDITERNGRLLLAETGWHQNRNK